MLKLNDKSVIIPIASTGTTELEQPTTIVERVIAEADMERATDETNAATDMEYANWKVEHAIDQATSTAELEHVTAETDIELELATKLQQQRSKAKSKKTTPEYPHEARILLQV